MKRTLLKSFFALSLVSLFHFNIPVSAAADSGDPIRLAVMGLHHGHANGLFNRIDPARMEIVGIWEPNPAVAEKYRQRFELDAQLLYQDPEAMLDTVKPEAVTVFTSTLAHKKVVEWCAPRGIHVMVEKPLATTYQDALDMAALARKHQIHLLTNYETTWHPTVQEAIRIEKEGSLGPTRRIIFNHGHRGPGRMNEEFVSWLTDPVENGGGALMDFGCYGANIITHMMEDGRPTSVTAITQSFQPEEYPKVEDDATIILTYPGTKGIIQASWNWPVSRKDLQLYGAVGALETVNPLEMFMRTGPRRSANSRTIGEPRTLEMLPEPNNDPWTYFHAVIRGEIDPEGSLSSLENNLITMEILDAAKESARLRQTVFLK